MNGDNIPAAKQSLHSKIFLLANRFMFTISRKHNRNDIKVAMLFPGKNYPATSSKIDQALNLISEYDPRRYLQIRRDVKKIWISAAPGYCANWMDELQTCILDSDYFYRDNVSASEVALT